jgi:hypothetical protein
MHYSGQHVVQLPHGVRASAGQFGIKVLKVMIDGVSGAIALSPCRQGGDHDGRVATMVATGKIKSRPCTDT